MERDFRMNGVLPNWLERWLGVEPGPGEGTAWSLDHAWTWAPWMTLLFLAAAAALVVAVYWRENRQARTGFRMLLAGIRIGLVVLVLLLIAQFMLALSRTGLPYVAVLLDDSLSMTVADRYDESLREAFAKRVAAAGYEAPSRWDLARTLLTERDARLLRQVSDGHRLRLYYLTGPRLSDAEGVGSLVAELAEEAPHGDRTPLGAAVQTILDDLRGTAPAAIVLLTDGINTEGPSLAEAADVARRRGVPLFPVGLGDTRPVRDVRLTDLLVDDVVFVDDVVYFDFQVTASGYEGESATAVLREEGRSEVLARRELNLGPDGQPRPVRLSYRPQEEGEFTFVVEVEPLEGELTEDNNRQERLVRVRREQIRVLLVAGQPTYEFRYLRNLLVRDDTIQLRTFLQEADPEYADQDAAALRVFPVRRDDLFDYDVVILGDVDPRALGTASLANLAEFVERPGGGGSLILQAGPRYMPLAYRDTELARLLPVEADGVQHRPADAALERGVAVSPTELGLASPLAQLGEDFAESLAVWRELPRLHWLVEAPDVRPGGRVLLEAPELLDDRGRTLPVLVMHFVGGGQVVFQATDETWRWRFRAGETYFARYWVQLIRYLSRAKLGEGEGATLVADRREYRRGEPVQLRLRFADPALTPTTDDAVVVVLEREGHATERIALSRSAAAHHVFERTLREPAIGEYRAYLASPALPGPAPSARFSVAPPPGEFARVAMDAPALRQAAEVTGGRFFTMADADQLPAALPPGRQVPVETLPPTPLWNRWPALLLVLALLTTEWLLRKAGGMV